MSDIPTSQPRPMPTTASTARVPTQERSQQRVALALAAAEAMLERCGPEETSIPEIAKAAGVPRASLYQFFPNKYVLFAHLAEQHLLRAASAVAAMGASARHQSWRELIPVLIRTAATYYNTTPVAGMLILGGPFSRSAYLAQEVSLNSIGREVQALLASLDTPLHLPDEPDATTIAVELAFACMKHGYYRENHISDAIQAEAARAVTGYLAAWETTGK